MFWLVEDHCSVAQSRHRGTLKVDWTFTFACAAYNLVRMRNLITERRSSASFGRSVARKITWQVLETPE
jgi:hypothetical protein